MAHFFVQNNNGGEVVVVVRDVAVAVVDDDGDVGRKVGDDVSNSELLEGGRNSGNVVVDSAGRFRSEGGTKKRFPRDDCRDCSSDWLKKGVTTVGTQVLFVLLFVLLFRSLLLFILCPLLTVLPELSCLPLSSSLFLAFPFIVEEEEVLLFAALRSLPPVLQRDIFVTSFCLSK